MSEKLSDHQWVAEQMGSEGWTVWHTVAPTGGHSFHRTLASHLSEKDAKLIAKAPALESELALLRRAVKQQEMELAILEQVIEWALQDAEGWQLHAQSMIVRLNRLLNLGGTDLLELIKEQEDE